MDEIIQLREYPVNRVLNQLLQDKTTKKNIIFATDAYGTGVKEQMTMDALLGMDSRQIQPRVTKPVSEQLERTRKNGEVFTPAWVCNKMNNHCDLEWFGCENVFNFEDGQIWTLNNEPVKFDNRSWQEYVESKRLEITCGEAPYIVSRYDASTGKTIAIKNRIGILDRKLRVVNENVTDELEWVEWAYKAFQSVYGFEYQGDNLLIARVNLLVTFVDYMVDRWNRKPTDAELKKVANIIVWNFWQMDGMTGTIPFGKPEEEYEQMSFFDFMVDDEIKKNEETYMDCRIYDWKAKKSIKYKNLKEGK